MRISLIATYRVQISTKRNKQQVEGSKDTSESNIAKREMLMFGEALFVLSL